MCKNWVSASLKTSHNEGWFGALVHAPLMDIFSSIQDTTVKMTDIRSLGADVPGINHKHGAILRHDVLKLDLMVMEAKPNNASYGRAMDIKKLETGMAANLCSDIYLLEARLSAGIILMYKIGQFTLPAVASKCHELIGGLDMMIKIKRRIENLIALMQHAKVGLRPSSSPDYLPIV
ncbi:hypothetical protein BC939DRAFT_526834 [Gamsiella multidivaricata]|uniref:uncharacterized protein n=1 Tax=Gamsiella multidivaricata TaxID=101098 RepID=UPI00221EB74B|nr:uncharacterized protein BC939DRAFT_526834 [Gamsiella multidivaricata]KAI7828209.1 hypothetical protein BC939DRAFT_526834 [Gamsiella multidivaricata]